MKCNDVRELISLYIDNRVSESEKQEIENHLKDCQECEQELKLLENVVHKSHQLNSEKELPKDFHAQLMARIKAEEQNTRKTSSYNPWYSVVAAAFVVVLIFGIIGISKLGTYNNPEHKTAEVERINMSIKTDAYNSDTIENTQEFSKEASGVQGKKSIDSNTTKDDTNMDESHREVDRASVASEPNISEQLNSEDQTVFCDSDASEIDEGNHVKDKEYHSKSLETKSSENTNDSIENLDMTIGEQIEEETDKGVQLYGVFIIIGSVIIISLLIMMIVNRNRKRQ